MHQTDRIRMQHMLDAAKEARYFMLGRTRKDLETDRMLVLSLIKDLEIIGEAASKVTIETTSEFRSIPWRDIIGMRNHLIHSYFDVDIELVWDTVDRDLPPLIAQLEKALDL